MLKPRLMRVQSLTILRKGEDGYYNDDGDWVEGKELDPFDIPCNIQPFKQGKSTVDLPEGVRAKDIRVVYTEVELFQADEITNQEGDCTFIGGIEFECWNVEPWMGYGLRTDNYKVFFVRKDKMNRVVSP